MHSFEGDVTILHNKRVLGHILALITICLWGFAYVAIVTLLRSFTPVEIMFFRIGLATIVLFIIYPRRMGKLSLKQELYFMAAGAAGVTAYFLLQDFALTHTAAPNVSIIIAVSPVIVGLLSWWFLKSGCPKWTFFLGAVLALLGIGVVRFAGQQLEIHPLGDFLAMLAAVAWAAYSVLLKKIDAFGYHSIQVIRRVFLYGLIFLIPFILFSDFQLGLERFAEPINLASLLYLALGASAGGFVFWNWSLKQLGPVKVSAYVYLHPLIAVAAAVVFLGDQITWLFAGGLVLVLAGLMLSNRKTRAKSHDSEEAVQ